jgi:homoserine acetyltransferase
LFSIERALAGTARARAELTDANAFLRLAKAVQLYDVRDRVQRIRAKVLWATVSSDLLILPEYSTRGVQDLRNAGVDVEIVSLPTDGGHLDGLHFAGKFSESLRGFLNS